MRTSVLVLLLLVSAAIARERRVPETQLIEESAAIFTGTVISANFSQDLKMSTLCSAQIRVESIQKPARDLTSNAVIYYAQTGGRSGLPCTSYPTIELGQKIKLWCIRRTFDGHTNILFVPSAQWIKRE